jgi:hypothetical protein
MIRLTSNIKIGTYTFRGVVSVNVESSWDTFTDTCKITLPRRVSWKGKALATGSNPLIKKGDQVSVSLGYDDKNTPIFEGYVTSVSSKIPVEITCEDKMWKLKQSTFTNSYKTVTLKKLLQDMLLGDIQFEAPTVELGPFRVSKASPAQVLDELRNTYFLKSFFRAGKLYVGLAYWASLQKTHKIRFDLHVPEDGNNLEFVRKEDIKIKLVIIVISKDNSKNEFQYGDKEGEERTLYYFNITKAQADEYAKKEEERLRYDGYRGSLTIFGQPTFFHGDVADITDPVYPERDGKYLVKAVSTSYGTDGFRQTLELDTRVG